MSFNSGLSEVIDNVYDALIARIDTHIDRLRNLEESLERDLAVAQIELHPASDSDTESEDDIAESVVETLSQMALPHVRFNDHIYDINRTLETRTIDISNESSPVSSEGTVRQNYTPFTRSDLWRADYGFESGSDDETVVDEWIDPAESPTYEQTINGRILFGDFTD
jgi:hypothetical protein